MSLGREERRSNKRKVDKLLKKYKTTKLTYEELATLNECGVDTANMKFDSNGKYVVGNEVLNTPTTMSTSYSQRDEMSKFIGEIIVEDEMVHLRTNTYLITPSSELSVDRHTVFKVDTYGSSGFDMGLHNQMSYMSVTSIIEVHRTDGLNSIIKDTVVSLSGIRTTYKKPGFVDSDTLTSMLHQITSSKCINKSKDILHPNSNLISIDTYIDSSRKKMYSDFRFQILLEKTIPFEAEFLESIALSDMIHNGYIRSNTVKELKIPNMLTPNNELTIEMILPLISVTPIYSPETISSDDMELQWMKSKLAREHDVAPINGDVSTNDTTSQKDISYTITEEEL